jgi:hypothetical protein
MKTLSLSDAARAGFVSITRPINRAREAFICESIETSLSTCDACFIDVGNNSVEAARRATDLKKLDREDAL